VCGKEQNREVCWDCWGEYISGFKKKRNIDLDKISKYIGRKNYKMGQLFYENEKAILKEKGKKVAEVKINEYGDEVLKLSDWKALEKGKGYGKELVQKIIKDKPDVWYISTDGFTKEGSENIEKALPDFKIIDWRRSPGGGFGHLMRQDAIDYYVEEQEKKGGRQHVLQVHPSLHSKHEKKKNL
jgi:hypothetical protein